MKEIKNRSDTNKEPASASPILKWAGGKSQLLPVLNEHFPLALKNGDIDTYIEPFVGGGAVFFEICSKYNIENAHLIDANPELFILYNSLREDVHGVIHELEHLANIYLSSDSDEARKKVFYSVREKYNSELLLEKSNISQPVIDPKRAAKTIFLNRTCFNGLFRVNSKGLFNVPHGRYKNPTILFTEKLLAAAKALQKATIHLEDYSKCEKLLGNKTFIYYDPPYRPVSETSQFTSYSKSSFGDKDQIRLANTIKRLNKENVFQLLSNSDPTNYVDDPFFDNLYRGMSICRVSATRRINSNASKRGDIREILVKNY